MRPIAQLSRHLFDTITIENVIQDIESRFVLTTQPVTTHTITFFDTFDWRLYAKNLLCYHTNQHLYLTDFADNEQLPPLSMRTKPPRFGQAFPDCDIKQLMLPIIEMRALLPQATFPLTTQKIQILNRDKKIVAVITFSEMECNNDEPYRSVHLHEIRGYNKWFLKLSRVLESFGNPQPDTMVHRLTTVLTASGRTPLDYSSTLSLELRPDMPAIAATKTIYRALLSTMRINLPGILDDLDSEFLHDFRVAIRRTRSALALIKNVLPPEIAARFKKDFRYLGQITGAVRDLDVYLLTEEEYKARLPQYLQEGLHLFFQDLAQQRKLEQKKLVKALTSPRCQTILDEWQEFLESDDDLVQEKLSNTPVSQLANTIIRKRFKKVLRDGSEITDESPDEALHRLRIQGKKLRYVLEFFSSLYPQQEIKNLIRQLKLLQNNLGDFNDLSVQQDMLKYSLSQLKPGTIKTKKTSASIGGLLTALYHEHEAVRARFGESFTRFSTAKNITLYTKLFH